MARRITTFVRIGRISAPVQKATDGFKLQGTRCLSTLKCLANEKEATLLPGDTLLIDCR